MSGACLNRRCGVHLHRCIVALLLVLGAFRPLAAAPLTLAEAVRLAEHHAPRVKAGDDLEDAARADLDRAGRWPDPRMEFGVQNLPVQGPGAFNTSADSMTMRTIGFSQEIPSPSALEAERAGARAAEDLAAADTEQARLAARRSAATAWVVLWAAEEAQRELHDLMQQTGLANRAARARLAGGRGSVADVVAVRVAQAELANRMDGAVAAVGAARAALTRWIGREAASQSLADPPDFGRLPVSDARLLQAPDQQAALLAWGPREDLAAAALARARASKHPDWSLDFSYGVRAPGLPAMAMLLVSVRLPFFDRHREDQDILARAADLRALRAERADARRAEVEAVSRALIRWQGLSREVRRDRDTLLPLSDDRSTAALAAYRGGGSLQPWLDARRDEIVARIAYVDTLSSWGRAWVRLAFLIPEDGP